MVVRSQRWRGIRVPLRVTLGENAFLCIEARTGELSRASDPARRTSVRSPRSSVHTTYAVRPVTGCRNTAFLTSLGSRTRTEAADGIPSYAYAASGLSDGGDSGGDEMNGRFWCIMLGSGGECMRGCMR
jgi:hypothetical protein